MSIIRNTFAKFKALAVNSPAAPAVSESDLQKKTSDVIHRVVVINAFTDRIVKMKVMIGKRPMMGNDRLPPEDYHSSSTRRKEGEDFYLVEYSTPCSPKQQRRREFGDIFKHMVPVAEIQGRTTITIGPKGFSYTFQAREE